MKSQTGTEIKPFCVIWGKTKDGGWISLKSMWGSVQQLCRVGEHMHMHMHAHVHTHAAPTLRRSPV